MMKRIMIAAIAAALVSLVSGCATTGGLSDTGEAVLETTVRIAMRHALATPRAVQRAHNIRAVAQQVRESLTTDVTIATLTEAIGHEIDRLELDELARADAHDLLRLLAAIIESRVGAGDLKPDGVVEVSDFIDLVVSFLPPPAAG